MTARCLGTMRTFDELMPMSRHPTHGDEPQPSWQGQSDYKPGSRMQRSKNKDNKEVVV